jgi:REP element-mobilizing transposase RayT
MDDHIHILSDLHPSVALANYIRDIKVSSSKWMKASGYFPDFKGWGIKYCALTYSFKEKNVLVNYIKNQQEHYKVEDFRDEIKRLFKEQSIDMDEKWFWVDE